MEYFRLFFFNKKLLSFGIVLTFFSGFGKTFLISLYIPFILREFQLSNTGFSIVYGLATIASGISIIYIGRLIDSTELKKYSIMITFGLIASTLLLSFSQNVFFLALAIFGLRLSGQGLMNHICFTVISRYFKRCRGKAISISIVGQALGEGILPIIIVILISGLGWRYALMATAFFMFITVIPLFYSFLKKMPKAREKFSQTPKKKKPKVKEDWTVKKVLWGNQFYLLAPHFIILPFVFTALMFYMVPIAHFKNWSVEWMSICFMGFACANLFSSFVAGLLVDKFKATHFLPFYLLPLGAAIACILLFEGSWTTFAYLTFAGFSIGSGLITETAVIAEVYGLKNIGTVKSVFTTVTIMSSALGPLIMGLFLDMGYSFDSILFAGMILISIVSLNSLRAYSKKHKNLTSVWSIPKVLVYRKTL